MSKAGDEKFPARVYKDTVLAPLFEGVKRHHWRYQMEINQASAVLLAECGLLTNEEASAILKALDDILRPSTSKSRYPAARDFFFARRLIAVWCRGGRSAQGRSRTYRPHRINWR